MTSKSTRRMEGHTRVIQVATTFWELRQHMISTREILSFGIRQQRQKLRAISFIKAISLFFFLFFSLLLLVVSKVYTSSETSSGDEKKIFFWHKSKVFLFGKSIFQRSFAFVNAHEDYFHFDRSGWMNGLQFLQFN